jgi:hypothetical protein
MEGWNIIVIDVHFIECFRVGFNGSCLRVEKGFAAVTVKARFERPTKPWCLPWRGGSWICPNQV